MKYSVNRKMEADTVKSLRPNVFWDPVTTGGGGTNQSEYWRSKSTVPSVTTNLTLLGLVAPME